MNKDVSSSLAMIYAKHKLENLVIDEKFSYVPKDIYEMDFLVKSYADAYSYFRGCSFDQSDSSDKYISELSSADAPED